MPKSSKFPLFLLPLVVLNRVLILLTPFELIALSLCSKASKQICKSIRTQAQCCENLGGFQLNYSSKRKFIRLTFDSLPLMSWYFEMNTLQRKKGIIAKLRKFCTSMFRRNSLTEIQEGISVKTFVPDVKIWKVTLFTLKLYTFNDLISTIKNWILYLEDLFNVPLREVNLDILHLEQEEIYKVTDTFCSDDKKPLRKFVLRNGDDQGEINKTLIEDIIHRQNAKVTLELDFHPPSDFSWEPNRISKKPILLHIDHCHWISVEHLMELDFQCVLLERSTLAGTDLIFLLRKLLLGFTPKWSNAEIIFKENVDLDLWIREMVNLHSAEGQEFLNIEEIQKVLIRRVEDTEESRKGPIKKIEYSFLRFDSDIIKITMRDNKRAFIQIFVNPLK